MREGLEQRWGRFLLDLRVDVCLSGALQLPITARRPRQKRHKLMLPTEHTRKALLGIIAPGMRLWGFLGFEGSETRNLIPCLESLNLPLLKLACTPCASLWHWCWMERLRHTFENSWRAWGSRATSYSHKLIIRWPMFLTNEVLLAWIKHEALPFRNVIDPVISFFWFLHTWETEYPTLHLWLTLLWFVIASAINNAALIHHDCQKIRRNRMDNRSSFIVLTVGRKSDEFPAGARLENVHSLCKIVLCSGT